MHGERFDDLNRALAGAASRRGVLRLLGGGAAAGALATAGLREAAAKKGRDRKARQRQGGGTLQFPVEFTSALGSFVGTFDVTRFAVRNGQVNAIGTLTGTVTQGGIARVIDPQALSLPVLGSTTGTCEILDLYLGPLDLTLLGLRVQLNEIHLQITAIPGGGLLGDLLCAIANLLNGNGNAFGRLANLLNQPLGALGTG